MSNIRNRRKTLGSMKTSLEEGQDAAVQGKEGFPSLIELDSSEKDIRSKATELASTIVQKLTDVDDDIQQLSDLLGHGKSVCHTMEVSCERIAALFETASDIGQQLDEQVMMNPSLMDREATRNLSIDTFNAFCAVHIMGNSRGVMGFRGYASLQSYSESADTGLSEVTKTVAQIARRLNKEDAITRTADTYPLIGAEAVNAIETRFQAALEEIDRRVGDL